MVSYQRWTQIAFDEAKAQGLDTTVQDANRELISVAADVWNDRKAELSAATVGQAEQIAQDEITVS